MLYTNFAGESISALGLGMMRLPVIDGDDSKVDGPAVQAMVDYALEQGVNYFDTAWGYHNGESELVAGRALSRHPRDSYHLASKFPGYDVSNFGKEKEIFERQLEKCQTDHFDFYLMHNINEGNIAQYLDDAGRYNTIEYFLGQKEAGRIRHLGFSVHGAFPTFREYMERYGVCMEFCQIQHNYLDYEFQDSRAKIDYLQQHGVGITIMEPLRGGNLVRLSDAQMGALERLRPGKSAVDWAFRYVMGTPGLVTVLSGMSNMDQLKDNIQIFDDDRLLSDEQVEVLLGLGEEMANGTGVPCTACHYCTPHCPRSLDIPELLRLYNENASREGGFIAPMRVHAMPEEQRPSACIACGSCVEVCPQQIDIPAALAELAEVVE